MCIYLELPVKVFSTSWTSRWNSGSSMKTSKYGYIYEYISWVYLSENPSCVLGIPIVWHSFSFFPVITIFEIFSCIFAHKCFSCSNSIVPFLFLLSHYIGRQVKWENCKVMNSSYHDKIIISDKQQGHTVKLNLIFIILFHKLYS